MQTPSTSSPRSARFTPGGAVGLFLRGLAMGGADIIPGVSGGTIAFITGIYERFIEALKSLSPAFLLALLRGDVRAAIRRFLAIHWTVLLPLGAGIGLAIVLMSRAVTWMMDVHPGPTYGFFFGLILASAWAPFAKMRRRTAKHVLAAVVAAALAFGFVGLRPPGLRVEIARHDAGASTVLLSRELREASEIARIEAEARRLAPGLPENLALVLYDRKGVLAREDVALPVGVVVLSDREALEAWAADPPPLLVLQERRASLPWIFVCGSLAISAMILPGVSGSFLLLFLGQYYAVLTALHGSIDAAVHLLGGGADPMRELAGAPIWQDPLFLFVFGVGVLAGLATFSRVVSWLFHHAHDVTMAALAGFMIGALRQPAAVVMHAGESNGQSALHWALAIGAGALGVIIVLTLTVADARSRSRRSEAPSD